MSKKAHRFDASDDFVESLGGEHRREMIPVESVLPRMSLGRDDSVLDLGAGAGYFTFPVAGVAREVLAIDIEPKMLSYLRSRLDEPGNDAISLVQGEITALPIADGSVDHVLAAFVYHEVDSQKRLVEECRRVLKPSGRITVIDFQKRFTGHGPPIWVRKRPEHVISTCKGLFALEDRHDAKAYYQLRLRRL